MTSDASGVATTACAALECRAPSNERTWRPALRYITAGSTSSRNSVSATRRCSRPGFQ